MEVSASRFRIASLLSLGAPGALLSRPQPPELGPGSGGGSAPPSPRRERVPRVESPQVPGHLQPRSSFLIRDILADRRPDSDPGPAQSGPDEEKSPSGSSSDSESRVSDRGTSDRKKPRKARSAFSEQQLSRLERSFQKQKYLSVQDRMDLSTRLQLSDGQVKTWYQNRRTKWKRQSAAGLELMFLPTHFLYPPAPPTPDLYLYRGHAHHHTAPPLLHCILTHNEPHAR